MKNYISPIVKSIELNYEGLVAVSGEGGLNNGDSLGNQKVGGGTSNDFSNRRTNIWGDED